MRTPIPDLHERLQVQLQGGPRPTPFGLPRADVVTGYLPYLLVIYDLYRDGPVTYQKVADRLGVRVYSVRGAVLSLEKRGLVRRTPGLCGTIVPLCTVEVYRG